VCAVCGTDWCGFVGEIVCCVWDSLVWVCGSECVLCLGQFHVGLGGVRMGSVWESLERFWGNEFVLCVGHFRVGLWDRVCAVCGTVWCRFVGGSLRCVWYSLVCFEGESLCCVWDTLLWVFGRVCVLCVGQFDVG